VLDGVHRLLGSSLAMIQSLIADRDISLFDGTRLVPPQRFEHMVDVLYEKEAKKENSSDGNYKTHYIRTQHNTTQCNTT
jgi:hypothetical protein